MFLLQALSTPVEFIEMGEDITEALVVLLKFGLDGIEAVVGCVESPVNLEKSLPRMVSPFKCLEKDSGCAVARISAFCVGENPCFSVWA